MRFRHDQTIKSLIKTGLYQNEGTINKLIGNVQRRGESIVDWLKSPSRVHFCLGAARLGRTALQPSFASPLD
jgi:hypothetical protein